MQWKFIDIIHNGSALKAIFGAHKGKLVSDAIFLPRSICEKKFHMNGFALGAKNQGVINVVDFFSLNFLPSKNNLYNNIGTEKILYKSLLKNMKIDIPRLDFWGGKGDFRRSQHITS